MAEGARLESVYTGNRIVGSNPTPSAKISFVNVRECSNSPTNIDFLTHSASVLVR